MTLNNQQLDAIKAFIAKRGFTQADLQLELLDHVASRVEEKLGENPALGFDAALSETHREFGVFGFGGMEDGLRQSLERQYLRLALAEAKAWVAFPRVLLPIGFAVLAYQAYQAVPANTLLILAGGLIFALLGHLVALYLGIPKRFRKTLIVQSTTLYLIVPTIFLQVWIQLGRLMDQGAAWGAVFAFALLLVVFAYCAAIRVRRHALARCQELDAKYGVF